MDLIANSIRDRDFFDDLSQVPLGIIGNESHVLFLHALDDKEQDASLAPRLHSTAQHPRCADSAIY
jgi:hypothetical protein